MWNIPKYVDKWCSTILALCAEQYPLIYTETVLNFVQNLPEDDHGWFMAIKQEVTRNCGLNHGNIDYEYLLSTINRVINLNTQWHLSKQLKWTFRS